MRPLLNRSAALAFLLLLSACQAAIVEPAGWRAIDGDTLAHGPERWRLHGIDAPERRQTCQDSAGQLWPCGEAARARLAQLIDGRAIACQPTGHDRYGRAVGRCWASQPDGSRIDLSAALAREGLALAYSRYSRDYEPAQAEAQAAGRGIWGGKFQIPGEFRAKQ